MGAWLTAEERAEQEERIDLASKFWVGQVLDYGPYTRTVEHVDVDDRGRLTLYARSNAAGDGPRVHCVELAEDWADEGDPT